MKALLCLCLITISVPVVVIAQAEKSVSVPGIPFPLSWENTPERYSVNSERLTITAGEKTDMFRDPNAGYNTDNAPKLLFEPDSNFVLTASIQHGFNSKWDAGALVLKADEKTWIKFALRRTTKEITAW